MYAIHATRKLLDRVGQATEPVVAPSTALGNWYANALFWQPQVAILVNETTLLPLFVPLAPARTLGQRVPAATGELFASLGMGADFIEHECGEMVEVCYVRTASRSILGSMNDFVHQAEWMRQSNAPQDLLTLSRDLAHTPCRVGQSHAIWPDDEVRVIEARWLERGR